MVISDCFHIFGGNTGLTEEFIYNNAPTSDQESVEVYSGSTNIYNQFGYVDRYAITESGENIKIFEGESILVVRKGRAGTMRVISKKEYTANDDVYILQLKKPFEKKISLGWFSRNFQTQFWNIVTSKTDNATFNKEYLERLSINLPPYTAQKEEDRLFDPLNEILVLLRDLKERVQYLIQIPNGHVTIYTQPLNEIVEIHGGNSRLTEEFIYYNLPASDEDKIEILTSSTLKRTAMGNISKNAKPNGKNLKMFEGPFILVARNGYAGTMRYIPRGRFTTNDHAYVLILKKSWKDKINLEWFKSEYQELFWKIVTSKSDNATFSKEYAERQIIQIPRIDEQNKIMQKLSPLKDFLQKLQTIENNIDELLEYVII